jgi:hypothetical protein
VTVHSALTLPFLLNRVGLNICHSSCSTPTARSCPLHETRIKMNTYLLFDTILYPCYSVQQSLGCVLLCYNLIVLVHSHCPLRRHKQRWSYKLFVAWQAFVLWACSLLFFQLDLLIFLHTRAWSKPLNVLSVRWICRYYCRTTDCVSVGNFSYHLA